MTTACPEYRAFLRATPTSAHPWPFPAVALPEQHDEVGLDAGLLATLNLAQADLHGLLVERRLVAHAPAQVDGLKARVVLLAQLAQPGEDLALQRVALGFQVLKGRADKYSECAC
jgi:hypothetical protein